MVEDSSTADENSTSNKGVDVRSDSFPVGIHGYIDTETSTTTSTNPASRSLADVKNEIQNVLDLMGPSTPQLTTTQHTTSSDADNEESTASLPSVIASKKSVESGSSVSENKNSNIADAGTSSTINNIEDLEVDDNMPSCCIHAPCVCYKRECMCTMGIMDHTPLIAYENYFPDPTNKSTRMSTAVCKKRGIFERLKQRSVELVMKKSATNPCDLYKINICGREDEGAPPKRVVFDLVDGIPKPTSSNVATNTIRSPVERTRMNSCKSSGIIQNLDTNCMCTDFKNFTNETITPGNTKIQKNVCYDSNGNTRVDFYYFDHGNAQYFHTTDTPPVMKCEILAEKTEKYTTKFWAEFFASIHIGVSFCISFLLQLFKFLLYSIIRPLSVGLMQLSSDYFFKPFLTTFFNGLVQPILIFLYNIATSLRDLCDPIAEAFGFFFRELAVLFRAIRLCTYKKNVSEETSCECNNKRNNQC